MPIFLYFSERDHEYSIFNNKIMNNYNLDHRKYYKDFKEEGSLVDDIVARNPYVNLSNKDNLPTHELIDEDGTLKRYCAASKNWKNVDPSVTDHKSLHYCAQQRVYLLFKNRYTGEWEFPSTALYANDSFMQVRKEFFTKLSQNNWFATHK